MYNYRVFISALFYCLSCIFIYAQEKITVEGISYIGSGITVEEAKVIALNDAKQKALEGLGTYIESQSQVINGVLTVDEIKTITGAIITSKILETKKEIIGESFVLKIKVEFNIDNSSLREALSNYQERSEDKIIIKNLTASIIELQKDLINKTGTDINTLEIVDEITFTNERLGKLLTTKQVIDNEVEIQNVYKKKLEIKFYSEVIPVLVEDLNKYMKWETVPYQNYRGLSLKYIGNWKTDEIYITGYTKYTSYLDAIANEYNQLNMKVRPYFDYEISLEIPIYVYINNEKNDFFKIIVDFERYKDSDSSSKIYNNNSTLSDKVYQSLPVSPNRDDFSSWDIQLPANYSLDNIYDIEVRLGRINKDNVEFIIFRF